MTEEPADVPGQDYLEVFWHEAVRRWVALDDSRDQLRLRARTIVFSVIGFVGWFASKVTNWNFKDFSIALASAEAIGVAALISLLFILERPVSIKESDVDLSEVYSLMSKGQPVSAHMLRRASLGLRAVSATYAGVIRRLHNMYTSMLVIGVAVVVITLVIFGQSL